MARSFSQILLAAAVAAVVGGSAMAQSQGSPLQEVVTLLRLNKKEEALAKLREIFAADPSNADALQMYRSVSQDEWYMLMTHKNESGDISDIQKIAQTILERAKVETKERSRDESAIAALVATATAADSDYGTRQGAINKLVNDHGEFAVPALVDKLGNPDDAEGQIQAVAALAQLGTIAVLPLIEALDSSNALQVQNVAAALHHIGDARATPSMVHLANDDRVAVAEIARKFVAKHKASGNAVDLLLAQSKSYLKGNIGAGAYSSVVWTWTDGKLVAHDVSARLYPSELAKAVAAHAVRLAPSSVEARSALAQANLAQANMIETAVAQGDDAAKALEPLAAELKVAALASGLDAVRAALDAGIADNLAPVAIEAIQVLSQAESIDTIDQSALLAALKSGDKRVRYAAANALVRAANGAAVPNAEQVVGVLAEAVTEESVRTIQVIAPAQDARGAVEATSQARGMVVGQSDSALNGMRSLLGAPSVDVVVINEILPDRMPEDVIGNIKRDSRMANTKIVVVAKDEEAAKARFGEGVGIIKAPLTAENLVTAVNTALEGVGNAANERAEAYAAQSSAALLAIASHKGAIGNAVANLAAQLNRGDAVAVPAARALGYAGGAAELEPLGAALGGGGSLDLKKAAADAIGNIVHRLGSCPEATAAALSTALDAATDASLRQSIGAALGKANLPPAKKAELLQRLNRVASPSAEPAKTEG
jgi:HEAT repeat protein